MGRPRHSYRAASNALTPTEERVAACLIKGYMTSEICAALGIATRTAETHIWHIRLKVGAANNRRLIARLCWLAWHERPAGSAPNV